MSNTRNGNLEIKTNKNSFLGIDFNLLKNNILFSISNAPIEQTRAMATLSRTCKTLHQFFKVSLAERRNVAAKELLSYVLIADKIAYETVIKKAKINPALFFIKTTAMDYAEDFEGNYRIIKNWSPLQALFATGDTDLLQAIKPYIDAYVTKMTNDHQFIIKHIREKFPNGFEYPPSQYQFNLLAKAIDEDDNLRKTGHANEATCNLLAEFRKTFKPGAVESGHHFNVNEFIKAHEAYDQYFDTWEQNQLNFFCVKIIGFLERLLTAPYLMRVTQGSATWREPLYRSFAVMNYAIEKNIIFLPYGTDFTCELGKDFVIDSLTGRKTGTTHFVWRGGARFSRFCEINNAALSKIALSIQKQGLSSSCVIS